MAELTYEQLRDAVEGTSVALRSRVTLHPAGGPGDKVFPPTYNASGRAETKYAFEERVLDGEKREVVLLDSVASQANRLELALLEGWEAGELRFPNPFVDFTDEPELADIGRLTSLEAPHRIMDAIFRDSLLDGQRFRNSGVGRAVTDAQPKNATGLFVYAPASLLFGVWDSTGPKGGLGSKVQRALVSEIVGVDAVPGVKVSSRIDPLQIEKNAATVFKHREQNEAWTLDTSKALLDKNGTPQPVGKGNDQGRPSQINHGNVTPSVDTTAGGVTISHALQTTVISLAALRRLRFPSGVDGETLPPDQRRRAEVAARTALAALGVAALVYQDDYDLRSRCILVPDHAPSVELVPRDGSAPAIVEVDRGTAQRILHRAADEAQESGIGWHDGEIRLVPHAELVDLVKRSRDVAASEPAED